MIRNIGDLKKIENNTLLKILFFVFFFLAFVSTLFFKQLHFDGAYWALDVLNNQSWHWEKQYYRLSTLVLQTPAVLISKTIRNPFAITWAFCLGYALYPFLTLVFLYKLNKEKIGVLVAFFFSFLICIIPSWGFAVSVTSESICLSWVLFFSILVFDKYKILFILSSVALLFSYEAGFIFYPLAAFLLYREGKLNVSSLLFLGALTILQFIHLKYFIFPNNDHVHFKNSFLISFRNPYFYSGFLSIIFFGAASFIKDKKIIKYFLIVAISFFLLIFIYGIYMNQFYLRGISYENRIWAIPLSFICVLVFYETLKKQNYNLNFLQVMIILLAGISTMSLEAHAVIGQIRFGKEMDHFIEVRSGCYVLTSGELELLKGESNSIRFLRNNIKLRTEQFMKICEQKSRF